MLSVEMGGKTLTTPKDKLLIHINGKPMVITGDAEHVYVNDTRVDEGDSIVPTLIGVGIVFALWFTLIFTGYGAQFITWAFL